MNTPTTLDLLTQGRDRVAHAWTRAQFSYVGDHLMYVCALGGLTPAVLQDSDDIAHFWSLEYDYSDICGIPNGMQCDASSWLANAIRELYPKLADHVDEVNRRTFENASYDARKRHWHATITQPRWSLDNPLIVEFNDTPGRQQWEVVEVYERAIRNYRESVNSVAIHADEKELVISGD